MSGRIRTEGSDIMHSDLYLYIHICSLTENMLGWAYSVIIQCYTPLWRRVGVIFFFFFAFAVYSRRGVFAITISHSHITITAPLSTHFRYTHIHITRRRQVKVSREKLFGCGCVFSSFGTFDGTYNAIYPLIYAYTNTHTHTHNTHSYKTYIYKIRNNNIFWH